MFSLFSFSSSSSSSLFVLFLLILFLFLLGSMFGVYPGTKEGFEDATETDESADTTYSADSGADYSADAADPSMTVTDDGTMGVSQTQTQTNAYDNYNHYSGNSSNFQAGAVYTDALGDTITMKMTTEGLPYMVLKQLQSGATMVLKTNETSMAAVSEKDDLIFYAPIGDVSAKFIYDSNSGMPAIQLKMGDGNKILFTHQTQMPTSAQYFGSTGVVGGTPAVEYNFSYFQQPPSGSTSSNTSSGYSQPQPQQQPQQQQQQPSQQQSQPPQQQQQQPYYYDTNTNTSTSSNNVQSQEYYSPYATGSNGGSAYTATGTNGGNYSTVTGAYGGTASSVSGPNGGTASSVTGPNGNSAYYAQGPNGNSAYYAQDSSGNSVSGVSTNSTTSSTTSSGGPYYSEGGSSAMSAGIPKSQIPAGSEDLYVLKSEIVAPSCGNSSSSSSSNSSSSSSSSSGYDSDEDQDKPKYKKPSQCPPCPACARCPEPSFECKKVPNYNAAAGDNILPVPVLSDFSQFGM